MAETLAPSQDAADANLQKVDRFVVVCMENRSFDHLLGHRRLPGVAGAGPLDPAVDGLRGNESNLLGGTPFPVHRRADTFMPLDLAHSHAATLRELGGPGTEDPPMGGFARAGQRTIDGTIQKGEPVPPGFDAGAPMGYFTADQLPAMHRLAEEFCVCDRWFASVPGPTWPNRMFLYHGHSAGLAENFHFGEQAKDWNEDRKDRKEERKEIKKEVDGAWAKHKARTEVRQEQRHERNEAPEGLEYLRKMPALSLFDLLGDVDWRIYHAGAIPWVALLSGHRVHMAKSRRFARFAEDCKAGDLPPVTFLDPDFDTGKTGNDDHSPCDILDGQAFLASVYDALRGNPTLFSRTLLVVLYDEHGGFYDHVDPREQPATGDAAPFHHFGIRVPAILAGGAVPRRSVSHTLFDHTSVAASILRRFKPGLDPARLSARTGRANHFGWALTQEPVRTDFAIQDVVVRQRTRPPTRAESEFAAWSRVLGTLRPGSA